MTTLQKDMTRQRVARATPTDYVTELLLAPEAIKEAQWRANASESRLDELKAALKDEEATLLVTGATDGKNAEMRAAQIRIATKDLRAEIARVERIAEDHKISLRLAENKFSALRAIVRYLAREGEEG